MTHPDQADCAVAEPAVALAPIPSALVVLAEKKRSGRGWLLALVGIGLVAGLGWAARSKLSTSSWRSDDRLRDLPKMTVAKVNMSTVLTAWGRVESSHNTVIACELERLEMRNAGRSISSGGASTILTLIEEGVQVKKGDVLCTLDASEYDELARTQEIKTEQAAAAAMQARLNFEVAQLAVHEFREGLYDQKMQSFEGTISLSQADVERAADRLTWTEKMRIKGYASLATRASAERTLAQSQFDLMTSKLDMSNFLEYGTKKTLMELSSEVEKRRFELIANSLRVNRNREQLANYRRMIDLCTIRAPHDGFLIFAYDPTKPNAGAIEPGQTVRQGQKLFYLPDLAKMEVMAYIHESVAMRVREGMKATTRIEGLANRSVPGTVISVAPLPTNAGNWFSDEVKYFVGVVRLDEVPAGLKPGMSAEVGFDVDHRNDVLAVPSQAVAVEDGRDICYVAGAEGLERRPVTLGRSTPELLEVTGGLAEGDQVLLSPEKLGGIDAIAVREPRQASPDEFPSPEPTAPSGGPVTVD